MAIFTCKGICLNKSKCARKIIVGEYCWQHNLTSEKCSICLDDVIVKDDAELECNHIFHLKCVKKLRNNTCPLCRRELKSKKLKKNDLKMMLKRKECDRKERNSIDGSRVDYIVNMFRVYPSRLLLISQNQNIPEHIRTLSAELYIVLIT